MLLKPMGTPGKCHHIDPRCKSDSTANVISISGGKDSLAQWLLAIENNVSHTPRICRYGA